MAVQTIIITNFSGRLTRLLNGDLNSGFAKYVNSFGYDPFSKPYNLTWLRQSANVTGDGNGQADVILDGKVRVIGEATPSAYLIGSSGNLYKVQINSTSNNQVNSVVAISSVMNGTGYTRGGSLEFFGNTQKIYIGHDNGVNSINFDGTAETQIGTQGNYLANTYRPLKTFIGKLYFGNGTTIGAIDATGTVTSSVIAISSVNGYSELNPPLANNQRIQDLEVSPENDYLYIAASETNNPNILSSSPPILEDTIPVESKIYSWNGIDLTVTAAKSISSTQLKSLKTYLERNLFFTMDSFGAALNEGGQKIFTFDWSRPPMPHAIGVNGNFIFWSTREQIASTAIRHAMYYFGSLDGENPPGLWRVLSQGAGTPGVFQVPFNHLVEIRMPDLNGAKTSVLTSGIGTHYFSLSKYAAGTNSFSLEYFNIPPNGENNNTGLQGGVYETQTQLFSNEITVTQIRVYIEPAVAGNKFQLDLIGSDGTVLQNGTYNYTFGDISDVRSGSTAVERINFNPNCTTRYALGIRITNQGTTNMTFKKIEVDYDEDGK